MPQPGAKCQFRPYARHAIMFDQLLTITRNTFVESIRQPIFVLLLLVGAFALVLGTSLAAYTLSDDNRMLVDMGLSTLLLMGVLLAAFTATGVISKELDNKTVLTVVSKPVSRPVFVIGKYLGVAGAIALGFWVLTLVFLLTERHQVMQTARDPFDWPAILFGLLAVFIALGVSTLGNYLYRWPFTSTFVIGVSLGITLAYGLVLVVGKGFVFQSPATDFEPQLLLAILLVFEAVLILTAVAVAASTRVGQIMTLVLCLGTMFLCMNTGFNFGRFAESNPIAAVLYYLLTRHFGREDQVFAAAP